MASPNTTTPLINIGGVDYDQNEFIARATNNVEKYLDYKGITGDRRELFLKDFALVKDGLVSGKYKFDAARNLTGYDGNTDNQYYGKHSGDLKKDNKTRGGWFNTSERDRYNIGNVAYYLNRISGTMNPYTEPTAAATATTNKPKWDKNTMYSIISKGIFGDGTPNDDLINSWANEYDPIKDGVRGTEGRRNQIAGYVQSAIDDLENGKYDIDDATKAETIARLKGMQAGGLSDHELNQLGNFGKLLFTGEKFYSDPTSAEAIAEQRKTNPTAGMSEELKKQYEAELAEKAYRDKAQNEWTLAETNWSDSPMALETLDLGDSLHNAQELIDSGALDNDLSTVLTLTRDDWNKYRGTSDITSSEWHPLDAVGAEWNAGNYVSSFLTGILDVPNLFVSTYKDPNNLISSTSLGYRKLYDPNLFTENAVLDRGWVYNDKVKGIDPKLYMRTYLADLLAAITSGEASAQYRLGDSNLFILPDTVDFNKGSVLVVEKTGSRVKLVRRNLKSVLKDLPEDSREVIKNKFLKAKNIQRPNSTLSTDFDFSVRSHLLGSAILSKAQAAERGKTDEWEQKSHTEKVETKAAEKRADAGNRKPSETGFTDVEMARLGAMAGDVVSAIAAWVPGYGTAASAVTGLGSTIANLYADIKDDSVTAGQVLTGLGTNLVLDAAGLFGGAGKAAKIAKNVVRWAPKLMVAFLAVNAGPDAINALKKLTSEEKLTVNDWKALGAGLSVIAGASRVGAASYNKHVRFNAPKTTPGQAIDTEVKYATKQGTQPKKLPSEVIERINNERTTEGKLKALQDFDENAVALPAGISGGIGVGSFRTKGNKLTAKLGPEDASAQREWLREKGVADQQMKESYLNAGGLKAWMANHLASDYDLYARPMGSNSFLNYIIPTARKDSNGNLVKDYSLVSTNLAGRNRGYKWLTNDEIKQLNADKTAFNKRYNEFKTRTEEAQNAGIKAATDEVNGNAYNDKRRTTLQEYRGARKAQKAAQAELNAASQELNSALLAAADQAKIAQLKADQLTARNSIKSLRTPELAAFSKANRALNKASKLLDAAKQAVLEQQTTLKQLQQDLREATTLEEAGNKLKDINKARETLNTLRAARRKAQKQFNAAVQQVQTLNTPAVQQAKQDLATWSKWLNSINKSRSQYYDRVKSYRQAISRHNTATNNLTAAKKNVATAANTHTTALQELQGYYGTPMNVVNLGKYTATLTSGGNAAVAPGKLANFKKFINYLNNHQVSEQQATDILKNKAQMDKLRAIFNFKRGGHLNIK